MAQRHFYGHPVYYALAQVDYLINTKSASKDGFELRSMIP